MRTLVLAAALAGAAAAQEVPKPGAEHALLAKMAGTWDTTMAAGGTDHKGSVTFRMELGGLWLVGSMESEMGGGKFYGKSLETYDAKKGKYVSVWFDSMSAAPMPMEGGYDEKTKTLTMTGDGVGMDGKPAKWKSVAVKKDEDTTFMSMYVGDAKEPMFTVTYKRRKK